MARKTPNFFYADKVYYAKGEIMGRKVRIDFEEVAGYPQLGTMRVWVDGKEIKDGWQKANFVDMLKKCP